ncbi:hypothetical protein HK104_002700 [Borealophlyctis nickersoniae]|nr:hypothetical protein HK104_002700 [Borealophlyctis nickersoniae]
MLETDPTAANAKTQEENPIPPVSPPVTSEAKSPTDENPQSSNTSAAPVTSTTTDADGSEAEEGEISEEGEIPDDGLPPQEQPQEPVAPPVSVQKKRKREEWELTESEDEGGEEGKEEQEEEPETVKEQPQVPAKAAKKRKKTRKKKSNAKKDTTTTADAASSDPPSNICHYWSAHTCTNFSCPYSHDGPGGMAIDTRLTKLCRFHKSGTCKSGQFCPYSHDLKLEPCVYHHFRGGCGKGDTCGYSHDDLTVEQIKGLQHEQARWEEFIAKKVKEQEGRKAGGAGAGGEQQKDLREVVRRVYEEVGQRPSPLDELDREPSEVPSASTAFGHHTAAGYDTKPIPTSRAHPHPSTAAAASKPVAYNWNALKRDPAAPPR